MQKKAHRKKPIFNVQFLPFLNNMAKVTILVMTPTAQRKYSMKPEALNNPINDRDKYTEIRIIGINFFKAFIIVKIRVKMDF
ncbi:MAG: hypothetical protein LBM62_02735 [Mediterranea sp.]|jgi:hypothetical protein|nr:hypothetical protein [Mediterranea sp.]